MNIWTHDAITNDKNRLPRQRTQPLQREKQNAMKNPTVQESIADAVQKILSVASPSRIILFGSQARGQADTKSDIDLMVIEPTVERPAQEAARLYRAVGWVGVGVDILVYSEEEYASRSSVPGTVLHQARTEGEVVYDRSHH
jgi:predicted nucleotidyltransferase